MKCQAELGDSLARLSPGEQDQAKAVRRLWLMRLKLQGRPTAVRRGIEPAKCAVDLCKIGVVCMASGFRAMTPSAIISVARSCSPCWCVRTPSKCKTSGIFPARREQVLINLPGFVQFTGLMILKCVEQVGVHQVFASEHSLRMQRKSGTDRNAVSCHSLQSACVGLRSQVWIGVGRVTVDRGVAEGQRPAGVESSPPPSLYCPAPAVPLPTGPVPPVPPVVPMAALPTMSLFLSVRLPDAR